MAINQQDDGKNSTLLMWLVAIVVSLNSLVAKAANVTQINRYATVANKPLAAQVNPLLAVQQVHFPPTVVTVGDALTWWLRYSGYQLAGMTTQPASLTHVMNQPLPHIDRQLGPLTVHDGLEILVGQTVFHVQANPLTREVTFQLKPAFQALEKQTVRRPS